MRSFEVGVLFTPSLERAYRMSDQRGFCCTAPGTAAGPQPGETDCVMSGAWREVEIVRFRRSLSSLNACLLLAHQVWDHQRLCALWPSTARGL